jgi:hypothetical protein
MPASDDPEQGPPGEGGPLLRQRRRGAVAAAAAPDLRVPVGLAPALRLPAVSLVLAPHRPPERHRAPLAGRVGVFLGRRHHPDLRHREAVLGELRHGRVGVGLLLLLGHRCWEWQEERGLPALGRAQLALRHGASAARLGGRGLLLGPRLYRHAERGAVVHDVLVGPHGVAPSLPETFLCTGTAVAIAAGACSVSCCVGGGGARAVAVAFDAHELPQLHLDHLLRRRGPVAWLAVVGIVVGGPIRRRGHVAGAPGPELHHHDGAGQRRREVGEEAPAAERAGGVGQQPRVDALEVERVAALGQQPEPVVGRELAQAHGAVERVLGLGLALPAPAPADDDAAVEEHRERVDGGLVHAGVVHVEELLQLALERRDAVRVLPRAAAAAQPQQVAHQQVQQAAHEEDDRQDRHDEGDAGAYLALHVVERRRGRRRRHQPRRIAAAHYPWINQSVARLAKVQEDHGTSFAFA